MKKVKNLRKARFRAALALTEQTQDSWAAKEGIPPSVLSQVLDGKRINEAVMQKVEAFTAKHMQSVAA